MFDALITSKIRIKILMRLFLNPDRNAYLRELTAEFHASPSHIKEELDQLKNALGMDRILESMLERLGNLEKALLIDDYAEGKDTGIIDLVLVGNIDQQNLTSAPSLYSGSTK